VEHLAHTFDLRRRPVRPRGTATGDQHMEIAPILRAAVTALSVAALQHAVVMIGEKENGHGDWSVLKEFRGCGAGRCRPVLRRGSERMAAVASE